MKPMHQLSHVYEDFEPTSDWLCDVHHDTLLVYLPGFRKDQLKVQATSTQKLRILGERQIGENKWSRFRKEFLISSNYDLTKITAKFEKGILHVKHPHKNIATPTIPAAQQHQPAKTSDSQNLVSQPPKIEQNDGSQQQIPQNINPDKGIADGDSSKSAKNDLPKNIESKKNMTKKVGRSSNESCKCKSGGYRQALAKLRAEMKQPRQSVSLVMASLIVLIIGIYTKTASGFKGETDK